MWDRDHTCIIELLLLNMLALLLWNHASPCRGPRKCFFAPVLYQAFLEIGQKLGLGGLEGWKGCVKIITMQLLHPKHHLLGKWNGETGWWHCEIHAETMVWSRGSRSADDTRLLCVHAFWGGCRIGQVANRWVDLRLGVKTANRWMQTWIVRSVSHNW